MPKSHTQYKKRIVTQTTIIPLLKQEATLKFIEETVKPDEKIHFDRKTEMNAILP